jgi:acyl carrier protein
LDSDRETQLSCSEESNEEGRVDLSEISTAVVRALAIELKASEEDVRGASSLKRELRMDSIAAVNVVFMLEEEYDVVIEMSEGDEFDSLAQIVEVVRRAVGPVL